MNYNVLIIGCGNIGLRYVQAIDKLNLKINLYLSDKDLTNISLVKNEFKQKKNINLLSYSEKLSPKNFDLLIISTTANARVNILHEYLLKIRVKKIILEKVLCQSLEQLKKIQKLKKKYKLKIWVSCNRSLWPDYIKLKKKLFTNDSNNSFSLEVKGYNWGLGCNSIHYIHLANFLFGKRSNKLKNYKIRNIQYWKKSKREGFKDFHGKILIISDNKSKILLEDLIKYKGKNKKIFIYYCNNKILIDETKNKITFNNKKFRFGSCDISNIFINEIKKILILKKSGLPDIEESYYVHYHFIKNLLPYWNKFSNLKNNKILPIT